MLFQLAVYQMLMHLSLKVPQCYRHIAIDISAVKLSCMFYYVDTSVIEQLLLSYAPSRVCRPKPVHYLAVSSIMCYIISVCTAIVTCL